MTRGEGTLCRPGKSSQLCSSWRHAWWFLMAVWKFLIFAQNSMITKVAKPHCFSHIQGTKKNKLAPWRAVPLGNKNKSQPSFKEHPALKNTYKMDIILKWSDLFFKQRRGHVAHLVAFPLIMDCVFPNWCTFIWTRSVLYWGITEEGSQRMPTRNAQATNCTLNGIWNWLIVPIKGAEVRAVVFWTAKGWLCWGPYSRWHLGGAWATCGGTLMWFLCRDAMTDANAALMTDVLYRHLGGKGGTFRHVVVQRGGSVSQKQQPPPLFKDKKIWPPTRGMLVKLPTCVPQKGGGEGNHWTRTAHTKKGGKNRPVKNAHCIEREMQKNEKP